MDQLDRLGWAGGTSFDSHGLRIGIRANSPEVISRIENSIPRDAIPDRVPVVDYLYSVYIGAKPRRGMRNFHQLYLETERLVRTVNIDNVFEALESHLDFLIASEAPRDIFVHAGVVAWNGRVIIIPGPSMSGKTMLVAALLRVGASYYSDDFAVLDENGNVHPFPRPLSLRQADGGHRKAEPTEFNALIGRQPLPVGLVVDAAYHAGASWRARTLTPGRALLTLLKNTVPAHARARDVLPVLREIALRAPAIKSRRGEADDVVQHILQYLR
jgi:hypothetical protein